MSREDPNARVDVVGKPVPGNNWLRKTINRCKWRSGVKSMIDQ